MKIYFAGSIRGGREDKDLYRSMINELQKYGNVLTEHIGEENLSDEGENMISDTDIFTRDMNWVMESDVVVAEVTTPSLGVGYELGQAQSMNKKTLCLKRQVDGKRLSAMISGNLYFDIKEYKNLEDVVLIFKEYFDTLS